jgi:hypothetical protein
MSKTGMAALVTAAVLAAGCGGAGGADDGFGEELGLGAEPTEDAGDDGSDGDGAIDASRMPDVVGMPAEEAVALLEDLGFRVSTGIVRTTETEPDLVHRSEPAADRPLQPGQGITLRIAAEPRE